MASAGFEEVPERLSFPKQEEAILEYWRKVDAFKTSLKKSKQAGRPEYSFYDGPPFATGLPHYGHILAGTIKDVVTRYAHQTGHHVERRFGWDCHGLPIEFEIDSRLGVKTQDDVLKMGIDKYNEECRSIVMRYSSEWEVIVERMGRWIDFKNDYKTMNASFMESVWWVFKQLYEKDLVYRHFRVMPYSTACTTPLSNFEANQNYKEAQDPSVIVSFPLVEDKETKLLAWTTTPWTLPSNLALCVNPDFVYLKLKEKSTGNVYIIAETRLIQMYKSDKEYEVLKKMKGSDLKGKEYVPLFEYFLSHKKKGAFRVLNDTYVTSESGTGIVHQAPAFGEDDYRVCEAAGIIEIGNDKDFVCPVDANGRFTDQVPEFQGEHIKAADKGIMKLLKEKGRLVNQTTFTHNYPFCWRSDTPLIYKAVPSWFVKVSAIKDKLLANNKQSYWVPEFVQEKRFHNWLADARDWNVSRNRYWGTPLPIWVSEDYSERVVVGSIQELADLSGVKLDDIHREFVDKVKIPSKKNPGTFLHRVPEVFDCWFESGSMPYASVHYPFENKERFESIYPADFIAEGLDQTRGWFYTLLVLSTALFDKPAFKNLIVNGLVLAADGRKMSKRLKNYPEPSLMINEHGADAIRLYLINSPVVRAEPLKFRQEGVRDVVKDVFLPWYNAYRFFVQNVTQLERESGVQFVRNQDLALKTENYMDRWIMAATHELIEFVHQEMKAYRLYTVIPQLVKLVDQLTNWYVRFNRKRLKLALGLDEARMAASVLFEVLYDLCRLMAPFTPFLAESMYQNLKRALPEAEREDSVHYVMLPQARKDFLNKDIVTAVRQMQSIIDLGRAARDRRTLPLKLPLQAVIVVSEDPKVRANVEYLSSYIKQELNVKDVILKENRDEYCTMGLAADFKVLGKRIGSALKDVMKALPKVSPAEVQKFSQTGKITVAGQELNENELRVVASFTAGKDAYEGGNDPEFLMLLDLRRDDSMLAERDVREIVNRVQRMRKTAGLLVQHRIEVYFSLSPKTPKTKDRVEYLEGVIKNHVAEIEETLRGPFLPVAQKPKHSVDIIAEQHEVAEAHIHLEVVRAGFHFDEDALMPVCNKDKPLVQAAMAMVMQYDYDTFVDSKASSLEFTVDGKKIKLDLDKHFFVSHPATLKRKPAPAPASSASSSSPSKSSKSDPAAKTSSPSKAPKDGASPGKGKGKKGGKK